MDLLDDYNLVNIDGGVKSDFEVKSNDLVGVGSIKRKELYGIIYICVLFGFWIDNIQVVVFYVYKIDFICNIVIELYLGFVLLIDLKLDYDVFNVKVDLYLFDKMVYLFVVLCGEVYFVLD